MLFIILMFFNSPTPMTHISRDQKNVGTTFNGAGIHETSRIFKASISAVRSILKNDLQNKVSAQKVMVLLKNTKFDAS